MNNSINENAINENDEVKPETEQEASADSTEAQKEKVKIEFPFSEKVREKAPKAFEVAENVATQWKNDEKFEVGLAHPLAEVAAVKALEKAKEVEKKLEEKGVITAAKMGVEIAKLQAQSLLSKIKKS
ncbi:MAG: hypothetical protein NDI63_02485 [Pseudobdellovibrio sp.]|nr:hypothetical protein [Pseudobdellovibrio sp.]